MACLFVYGTLLVPAISEHVLGRPLVGFRGRLRDFFRSGVEGEVYPAVIPRVGSSVEGLVCEGLESPDLDRLDAYEGELYRRAAVRVEPLGAVLTTSLQGAVKASTPCETYIFRPESGARLTGTEWSLEEFQRRHAARFGQDLGLARIRSDTG